MNATPNDAIGPLSGEQISQLMQSRDHTEPIRKASRFASYYGRLMFLSAAVLALFSFSSSDAPGMVLAALLAVFAFREMKLAKPLRQLNPSALTGLAMNQVMVGMAVVAYAVWYLVNPGSSAMVTQAQAAMFETVPEAFKPYESYLGYAMLIAGTVMVQGLTMMFYLSKKKTLGSFATQCPPWIVDLYRRGVMG